MSFVDAKKILFRNSVGKNIYICLIFWDDLHVSFGSAVFWGRYLEIFFRNAFSSLVLKIKPAMEIVFKPTMAGSQVLPEMSSFHIQACSSHVSTSKY